MILYKGFELRWMVVATSIIFSLVRAEQRIVSLDLEEKDQFGESVAISNNYAIIGANFDGNGAHRFLR